MSLPKINYPLFDVIIPSVNQKIKMRPFLVKEEKILLMAQTTGNSQDIVTSITQVVNNCIVDDIDVDNLTTFDLEYLFVKLRARSVNNKIDVFYKAYKLRNSRIEPTILSLIIIGKFMFFMGIEDMRKAGLYVI